jgi:hypothetical protein
MISNYEFIKAQSFEVAWAIFRCTELFSQSDLRKKVESAAVDLIADYDVIGNDMENEFPRIEKLVSLVRLAESVKQITSVNANVLYRELDNLTKATRLEIIERRDKKNIAVSLENIFTNSAYVKNLTNPSVIPSSLRDMQSDFSRADSSVPQGTAPLGMTRDTISANQTSEVKQSVELAASQFGNIESLISAAVQSSQPITEPVIPAEAGIQSSSDLTLRQSQGETTSSISDLLSAYIKPTSANTPAPVIPALRQAQDESPAGIQSPVARQSIPTTPTNNMVRPVATTSPSAGSWQHVILQKVKELNQTTTKELTSNFPEISERTVRFYLQKLVDNGQIDRIGSTGPGAAYRAK